MPNTGSSLSLSEAEQINARANELTLRGIALLTESTPASLREAIACFDEAIALRNQLPLAANPWFRYGLIAGWMNRGDALTRLGSREELRAALKAYDEALIQLRELPMHESPLFVQRLAIAWMNRGITLLTEGSAASVRDAAMNFAEAINAARNFLARNSDEGRELLACALMNRGNALIRVEPPDANAACACVKEALKIISTTEPESVSTAEIGFKARHILCQAIAHLLTEKNLNQAQRDALLAEATDVVESGITLGRNWEVRGTQQFRAAVTDLFRFGCRVYQIYQPHFLTDFLLENMENDSFAGDLQMHTSAVEALWHALVELQREGLKNFNSPNFNQAIDRLRELRVTEERLAELRRRNAK